MSDVISNGDQFIKIFTILLGSSVLVAIITLIGNIVMFKLNRKAKKEDDTNEKESKIIETNKKLDKVLKNQDDQAQKMEKVINELGNVTEGTMILLKKEIEDDAAKCISAGKIKLKTREELHTMHSVYHNKLHGNGGLDSVMEAIDELRVDSDI